MKVQTAQMKVFLRELFLTEGRNASGQPIVTEKRFPFSKLGDVMTVNEKLLKGSTLDKTNPKLMRFTEDEVEFTPAEVAILIDLFDSIKDWTSSKAKLAIEFEALTKGGDADDKKSEEK